MSAVKSEKHFFMVLAVLVFIGVVGPCIMFFMFHIDDTYSYFIWTLLWGVLGFFLIDSQVEKQNGQGAVRPEGEKLE